MSNIPVALHTAPTPILLRNLALRRTATWTTRATGMMSSQRAGDHSTSASNTSPQSASSQDSSSILFNRRSSPAQSLAPAIQFVPTTSRPTSRHEDVPLPPFLKQSKSDIHAKFIDLEWQQRERQHEGAAEPGEPQHSSRWAKMKGDEVARRNRYMNVDPYANNRVRLRVPEGQNDYINASPIRLLKKSQGLEKTYIATQGPKDLSTCHFWRMVWYETSDPARIVILTQTHESGREKCFTYFPLDEADPTMTINAEDEFNDGLILTLTLEDLSFDIATGSEMRLLSLTSNTTGETKVVHHFLYSSWPDFFVPEGADRAALLNLVRATRPKELQPQSQVQPQTHSHPQHPLSPTSATGIHTLSLTPSPSSRPSPAPQIVHCSAGVGRTGTFIALDWLLSELDSGAFDGIAPDNEYDPIVDVVERLRLQRMMMVQGEQQFGFLYEVVRELWAERWRKLDASRRDGPGGDGAKLA